MQRNGLARTSLVMGIIAPCLSIFGCAPICVCIFWPLGGLVGLAAIILGIMALLQIKANPALLGRNEAIVGICLGALPIVIMVGFALVSAIMHFAR